ncbi:MAG: MotA/TolQ/ExbB proton channel family protein [Myxococcales bacterium]|nr:MotA/TolQ/ExbB proton channel family protein [Myxococcales bacterium]
MSLYEFLEKGGLLMIPLVFMSVVSISIFLERMWALRRSVIAPLGLGQAVRTLIRGKKFDEAEALCEQSGTALARIAMVGIRHRGRHRAIIKESMEERGNAEVSHMERRTGAIATVATIAPLLGLLGTVTGMITVFQDISAVADPEMSTLAGGIWEALITTAAGLTVAIPAFALHRFLISRVDRLSLEMADESLKILETLDEILSSTRPATVPNAHHVEVES